MACMLVTITTYSPTDRFTRANLINQTGITIFGSLGGRGRGPSTWKRI